LQGLFQLILAAQFAPHDQESDFSNLHPAPQMTKLSRF